MNGRRAAISDVSAVILPAVDLGLHASGGEPLGRYRQPRRTGGLGAAARVEGDATRAAIGLDAVGAVDAIEAVEIALDGGWTREAYARAKRER